MGKNFTLSNGTYFANQKFKLEGAKELDQVLKKIGDKKLQQKILRAAMRKASKVLTDEASRLAPVSANTYDSEKFTNISGKGKKYQKKTKLKDSIKIRFVKEAGVSLSVQIGPTATAFHGMFQEFGTEHHGAKPYLRPAFDTKAPEMMARLGEEFGKELEKTAEKLAGSFGKSGLSKKKKRR